MRALSLIIGIAACLLANVGKMHMEDIWLSIKKAVSPPRCRFHCQGIALPRPTDKLGGYSNLRSARAEPYRIASHQKGTELLPASGETGSLNAGRKGFTLNILQCEIRLKSGFGSVKVFHAHSSDGGAYIHTHIPAGQGMFSAGQEWKKTRTGCCNTCSMRLATHIANILHRNIKKRD